MYKKLLTFLVVLPFLMIGFIQQSFSNKNNPPNSQTGALSEASCGFSNSTNTCHGSTNAVANGSSLSTLNTDVKLFIGSTEVTSTFKYKPDSIYAMTLKLENPNTLNGFSLTVENNGNIMSGSLSIPAGSSAVFNAQNSDYINQDGNAGVSEWDFNWAAPAQQNGDVTFYASINRSNSNNGWSGDEIIPFKLEITEEVEVVDPTLGIAQLDISNEVSNMKNPIQNDLISFQVFVKEPKQYFVSVYDLSGKLVSYQEQVFHAGIKDLEIPVNEKGLFILNIRTNKNESASFKILNK